MFKGVGDLVDSVDMHTALVGEGASYIGFVVWHSKVCDFGNLNFRFIEFFQIAGDALVTGLKLKTRYDNGESALPQRSPMPVNALT